MTHDVIDFRGPDRGARIAARLGVGSDPARPADRAEALLEMLRDDAELAAARHELLDRMRRTLPFAGQAEDLYLYVMKNFYPRVLEAHLAAFLVAYLEPSDPSEGDAP